VNEGSVRAGEREDMNRIVRPDAYRANASLTADGKCVLKAI
jgi:hypothetical protein